MVHLNVLNARLVRLILVLAAVTVASMILSTVFSLRANTLTVDRITETMGLLAPAIRYELTDAFTDHLEICPGEVLPPFGYTVVVNRPAIAQIVSTWAPITPTHPEGDWGAQTGGLGGTRRLSVYPVAPQRYDRVVMDAVVPDLQPGPYMRLVAAEFEGSQLELYTQRVDVLSCGVGLPE